MKKLAKNILFFIALSILILSCSSPKKNKTINHDETMEGKLVLNELQQKSIELKLDTIQKRAMDLSFVAMGTLQLSPNNKSKVLSYIGGYIKSIQVFEGDKVKKGQILATIENPEFIKLQQKYIEAFNHLVYLKKAYIREKSLYTQKINASKDFQKTESQYKIAQSKYSSLKIQLEMLDVNTSSVEKGKIQRILYIHAPINGYVNDIQINIGSYVDAKTQLFAINNTQKMHADVTVYEENIKLLLVGQQVDVTIGNSNPIKGKVLAIAQSYAKDQKGVKVHIQFLSSTDKLIEGTYIQALIHGKKQNYNAVNEEAIVSIDNNNYVFIKDDKSTKTQLVFSLKKVKTVLSENGYTAIIIEQDINQKKQLKYVSNGAYYMLSEMQKDELEEH